MVGITRKRGAQPPRLGGQPITPFFATVCKNLAATDRGHAGAEAMATLADQSTGLVRSFHGTTPTRFARCIGALSVEVNAHSSQISHLRFCYRAAFRNVISYIF